MAKFKVGDRVKCLAESWYAIHAGEAGKQYIVAAVIGGCSIVLEGYPKDPGSADYRFELVKEISPIRTVTKRELVDGNYGKVVVEHSFDRKLRIYTNLFEQPTHTDLRAAANTLIEIADYLEAQ